MDYSEFRGKTVEEALTAASVALGIASTEIDFEVIDKGSSGFLGLGAKQAVIKAKKKEDNDSYAFLNSKNEIKASDNTSTDADNKEVDDIDLGNEAKKNQTEKVVENKDEIIKNTYAYLDELFKAMNIETRCVKIFLARKMSRDSRVAKGGGL